MLRWPQENSHCMRPITRVRFNALAGYCRLPLAALAAEEFAWFEHSEERVLGILARDRADNEFAGIVLGRDRRGRFRAVHVADFEPSHTGVRGYCSVAIWSGYRWPRMRNITKGMRRVSRWTFSSRDPHEKGFILRS